MAGGGNDREQNYWPGFVDALSNVVLTLVFVLVVFVFALAIMASKVNKAVEKAVEERMKQQQQQMTAPSQGLAGQSQSTALVQDSKGIELTAKEGAKQQANRGVAKLESTATDINVIYPEGVLDLDDASMANIKSMFENMKQHAANAHIIVESYQGPEPYSVAQRLAYYRGIRVRNMLIEGGITDAANISNKLIPSTSQDLGRVHVIFTK